MTEPTSLKEAMREMLVDFDSISQPMPIVRHNTGDRRLPDWLRNAVLRRDRFLCRWCGYRSEGMFLHIDHIVPWSAGGTNESTNLRVLCADCNETRSNTLTDAATARAMPITHECHNCLHSRPADEPHAHAFCLSCGRTSQVPTALIEESLTVQRRASA